MASLINKMTSNLPSYDIPTSGLLDKPFHLQVKFNKNFVNNEWVDSKSGKTFETVDPRDGKVITSVPESQVEDVDAAVKAARAAFTNPSWRGIGPHARARLMMKLADLIERDIDECSALESLDNGKPFGICKVIDIPHIISCYRYFAGWAQAKINGQTIEMDGPYVCRTVHEPVGVVGAVIPWNYPTMMMAWKCGPALAAGNTIIVKTSEKTPLSALKIASLAKEAGFPPGVLNVISGHGMPAGNAIASHMDIDKVAFTGSTAVGRKIMEAAAKSNLKKVSLELGGKSPSIVFPDVDMDEAVEGTHMALYFNAGQTCCAGTRTFVHESIYDEFVKRATERARQLKLTSQHDAPMSQGPQIDKIQYDKILGFVETGKKEGAKLLVGGKGTGQGYYIEPTVFADVQDDHVIGTEEIFGPVMAIMKWSTMEEVIERANRTAYGLAASIFTKDLTVANWVVSQLKAGTVWVNCHNILQPQAPFGGFKQSGFGRDLGQYALTEYTQVKTITTKASEGVPEIPGLKVPAGVKSTREQAELKQGERA